MLVAPKHYGLVKTADLANDIETHPEAEGPAATAGPGAATDSMAPSLGGVGGLLLVDAGGVGGLLLTEAGVGGLLLVGLGELTGLGLATGGGGGGGGAGADLYSSRYAFGPRTTSSALWDRWSRAGCRQGQLALSAQDKHMDTLCKTRVEGADPCALLLLGTGRVTGDGEGLGEATGLGELTTLGDASAGLGLATCAASATRQLLGAWDMCSLQAHVHAGMHDPTRAWNSQQGWRRPEQTQAWLHVSLPEEVTGNMNASGLHLRRWRWRRRWRRGWAHRHW